MKIEAAANVATGRDGAICQDGAIWGSLLFRFDHRGNGLVFDLTELSSGKQAGRLREAGSVILDRREIICPHSNAVFFGRDYYDAEDSFPLLYSNIYNNYSAESDRKEGVCCVYRLRKTEQGFSTALVQIIRIGFTDDALWRSSEDDVRPYGNFTADREKGILYAFTMRDKTENTRYFSFRLPGPEEGEPDPVTGIRTVTLTPADILDQFDCEYHRYIQGACCHNGLIYSVEGFTGDKVNVPALRIINPAERKQAACVLFGDYGFRKEAEMIDFYGDTCLYSDAEGTVCRIYTDDGN